jgi:hypothetical protein
MFLHMTIHGLVCMLSEFSPVTEFIRKKKKHPSCSTTQHALASTQKPAVGDNPGPKGHYLEIKSYRFTVTEIDINTNHIDQHFQLGMTLTLHKTFKRFMQCERCVPYMHASIGTNTLESVSVNCLAQDFSY